LNRTKYTFPKFFFKFESLIWPIVSHYYLCGSFLQRALLFFATSSNFGNFLKRRMAPQKPVRKQERILWQRKVSFSPPFRQNGILFRVGSPFFLTVRKESRPEKKAGEIYLRRWTEQPIEYFLTFGSCSLVEFGRSRSILRCVLKTSYVKNLCWVKLYWTISIWWALWVLGFAAILKNCKKWRI